MKGLIIMVFIAFHLVSYGQTNESILVQYNSLEEWESENIDEVLNQYYEGGKKGFIRDFEREFMHPISNRIYKNFIALIELRVTKDSLRITLLNDVLNSYEKQIRKQLKNKIGMWNIPWKKEVIIRFAIHYENRPMRVEIKNHALINLITYTMDGYCNYISSYGMMYQVELFEQDRDTNAVLFFLREYLLNNPFDKASHEKYYQYLNR